MYGHSASELKNGIHFVDLTQDDELFGNTRTNILMDLKDMYVFLWLFQDVTHVTKTTIIIVNYDVT